MYRVGSRPPRTLLSRDIVVVGLQALAPTGKAKTFT
jgi:hypothetical protein